MGSPKNAIPDHMTIDDRFGYYTLPYTTCTCRRTIYVHSSPENQSTLWRWSTRTYTNTTTNFTIFKSRKWCDRLNEYVLWRHIRPSQWILFNKNTKIKKNIKDKNNNKTKTFLLIQKVNKLLLFISLMPRCWNNSIFFCSFTINCISTCWSRLSAQHFLYYECILTSFLT